jgi:hypothetical protein
MQRILLAALIKVELPGHTACLIDGGTLTFAGDIYLSSDSLLGVAEGVEALSEGAGDEAPAGALTFILPDTTPSSSVNTPAIVDSRVRLWLAEVGMDTGAVIGTPDNMADWMVDYPEISIEQGVRRLTLNCVSQGQRLFNINMGNSLSPKFHERIYPGEFGFRNAVGVPTAVPWGAASAPRGASSQGSGAEFDPFAKARQRAELWA